MTKTLINLKDNLLEKAKKLTGIAKKVDIVNMALENLVKQKEIEKILDLRGKVNWSGNLDKMRADRR